MGCGAIVERRSDHQARVGLNQLDGVGVILDRGAQCPERRTAGVDYLGELFASTGGKPGELFRRQRLLQNVAIVVFDAVSIKPRLGFATGRSRRKTVECNLAHLRSHLRA